MKNIETDRLFKEKNHCFQNLQGVTKNKNKPQFFAYIFNKGISIFFQISLVFL